MSDDEFLKYQKRIAGWVFAALFSSIGINQGIQSVTTVRHDPFTGTDARQMEERFHQFVYQQLEIHDKLIPPEKTRARIRAIETYLNKKYNDYTPPYYSWGNK